MRKTMLSLALMAAFTTSFAKKTLVLYYSQTGTTVISTVGPISVPSRPFGSGAESIYLRP